MGEKSLSSSEVRGNSSTEERLSSSSAEISSSSEVSVFSSSSLAEWEDYCLEVVNAYRATEGTAPLVRASVERESCTVEQASSDMADNSAHGHFGDCNENAQNTGPNINTKWYGTEKAIVDAYVSMMWEDEKALVTNGERDPDNSSDYPYIGHYLNMRSASYTSLACGIAYSSDGSKAWFNMNFYR